MSGLKLTLIVCLGLLVTLQLTSGQWGQMGFQSGPATWLGSRAQAEWGGSSGQSGTGRSRGSGGSGASAGQPGPAWGRRGSPTSFATNGNAVRTQGTGIGIGVPGLNQGFPAGFPPGFVPGFTPNFNPGLTPSFTPRLGGVGGIGGIGGIAGNPRVVNPMAGNANQATTAVCTSMDTAGTGVTFTATIRRTLVNIFLGFQTELVVDITTGAAASGTANIVLTSLGGGSNTGGCSAANLGTILQRGNFDPFFNLGTNNGVLETLTLQPNQTVPTKTFRTLPISSLQEAFGISIALCTGVEQDSTSNSVVFGLNSLFQPRNFRCTGTAQACCTFGRFTGDAR